MIAAGLLVAYAAVLAIVGPRLLSLRDWPDRAPRLALAAWLTLSATTLASLLLAGVALVVSVSGWSWELAELLDTCVMMLRAAYAAPGSALVATAGLLASALLVAGLIHGVGAELWSSRREGRRHARVLHMVGRRDARLGAVVIDHAAPAAYCLPGRGGRIVLTTSTLAALDDRQVAGVIAHERAHLRARHHLLRAAARGIERALPFVPALRLARREVSRLTELAADALLTLASGPAPSHVMAASGGHTAQRVRRLIAGHAGIGPYAVLAAAVLVVSAAALPPMFAAAPAILALGTACCP